MKKKLDLTGIEKAKQEADECFGDLVQSCLLTFAKHGISNEGFLTKVAAYNGIVSAVHRIILEVINGEYDDHDILLGAQERAVWAFIDLTCYGADIFRHHYIDDQFQRKLTKRCEVAFANLGKEVAEFIPDHPDVAFIIAVRDKMREGTEHSNEWK